MTLTRPKSDGSPLPDWQEPITEGTSIAYRNAQVIPGLYGYVEFWTDSPCKTYAEAIDGNALHRDNGPAEIMRGVDDQVESERWYAHGKLHRRRGPAETIHGDNGEIEETYWLDDQLLSYESWARLTTG